MIANTPVDYDKNKIYETKVKEDPWIKLIIIYQKNINLFFKIKKFNF